ncbi:hypothetical protein CEXT_536331 [Caerostris extrusa]|uniref:Uncharacterized protein n=1 Tax=Caerostris extrusa TaxID=172846 RepID=A0AAV4PRY1_CAEEX|nr:hypothetical protein CEXT_536331 [Caerostris extrusa]
MVEKESLLLLVHFFNPILNVKGKELKRGPEAGKYLLSCHPRLMANQYPPLPGGPFNQSALRFNACETIALSEESRSRDVIFDFAHHPSLSR